MYTEDEASNLPENGITNQRDMTNNEDDKGSSFFPHILFVNNDQEEMIREKKVLFLSF